jgi:signal peptidase I
MTHRRTPLLAVALGAVTLSMRRRVRRYEIAERSMSPALEPGDYVVAVRPRRELLRGDVVVLPHPHHGFDLVKRVIGLAGECVVIRDGRVEIAGATLAEPWAQEPTHPDGTWQLEAEIFVMGDSRANSAGDSRTVGPLPLDHPIWRVAYRYWPPTRIGWV